MKRLVRVAPLATAALAVLVTASCSSAATGGTGSRTPADTTRAISSAECAANRAAGVIKFGSPFLYDASAGIIDVFAAIKLGYFRDLCLDVTFNPTPKDVYAEVSSGVYTVSGEGSAADDLVAVGHDSHFTAIATYGDTSDYAILTKTNVSSLRQLEGKTLGYHVVLPVALQEMLTAAKVDVSKVKMVNDTSYDPTLLFHGPYQALQAYQSNEPFQLAAAHDPVTVWKPSQFGVSGTFNVEIVNNAFLVAHSGAVKDFLRAELHGFAYCASHVSQCVGFEATAAKAAGSYFDAATSAEEWRYEVALATDHTLPGKGVGVESTAEWTPELDAIVGDHLVSSPAPVLSKVEDTALAATLYRGKTLIWP